MIFLVYYCVLCYTLYVESWCGMAYFLKKSPLRNRIYLQIVDGVYNPKTKNSKQTVYKKLGYLDALEITYNDPISYFQKEVDILNRKRKERDVEEIPTNEPQLYNLGNFPFVRLYKELYVSSIVNGYQALKHHKGRYKLSDVFEALIYSRIINPSSKLVAYNSIKDSFFQSFDFSKDQMYEAIELLGEQADVVFEGIQMNVSKKYRRNLKRVYFDCTNFYFEIDKPTSLVRPGPSKEGRSNPIVGLGLLLDADSIPLDYAIYPGNQSEKPIFRQVLNDMKGKNNIRGRVIRIADKGLNSGDNIADCYYNKDGYIFSQTVKGANKEIKRWILDPKGYRETRDGNGEVVYKIKSFIDNQNEITITTPEGKKMKVSIVQKQIVFWSRNYAEKASYEREKGIEKLSKAIQYESYNRKMTHGFTGKYIEEDFINKDGEIIEASKIKSINEDKIKEDELLDGYYLIVTSEVKTPDEEIIDAYRTLWQIEESFRITKTTLKARPVYHSLENSIKGHFLICMTALLFARIVEKKKLNSKVGIPRLIDSLRKYQCTKEKGGKYQLIYIDEVLQMLAEHYSIKLNQHYKSDKEIKKLF